MWTSILHCFGQLVSPPYTNLGHYISMIKSSDIWYQCDDVKILRIEFHTFNDFKNTVYMLFYKGST